MKRVLEEQRTALAPDKPAHEPVLSANSIASLSVPLRQVLKLPQTPE